MAPALASLLRTTLRLTERAAPGLTGPLLRRLFFTPPRHRPSAREEAFLAMGLPTPIPFEGRRLAAWTWGEGPRVLLLHGWGGRAGQLAPLAQHLVAAGYAVTAFDAPAHGRSPGRRSSLLAFSAALDAAVGHLGPVSAVVAHSLGGAATALSLSRGLPADRAVVIGAPALPRTFFLQLMAHLGVPESRWEPLCAELERAAGLAWADLEGPRILARSATPLLVIHDRRDREVPFAHGQALASAPGARFHPTEGLGHRRILAAPEVLDLVTAFLDDGTPTAQGALEAELFEPALR